MAYKTIVSNNAGKHAKTDTVFIQLTALGAYYIFGPREWALSRGGCLFEAGRLLNFHHFQQVKYVYFATKQ